MNSVLVGFGALVAVIVVGWLTGRARVLGDGAAGVLSRLSYFVATPALLLLTLAEADPSALLSPALLASAGSAVLCALLYAGLARRRWRSRPAELATGALASSYVNAGNLGVPIAVYVLGDASYVAPVLLFQVLVLAPVGLTVLAGSHAESRSERAAGVWTDEHGDHCATKPRDLRAQEGRRREQARERRAERGRFMLLLTQPLRTPVVVGCALGLVVAAAGWAMPPLVRQPIDLLAALAVPAALLAYGMSLHGAPRPASGDGAGQVWLAVALKTVAQPALAFALGKWVAQLDGVALLAVVITSALPTAQNVFVYATAYDRGTSLARDVVLLSTILSVPVLTTIAIVLGTH